MSLYLVCNSKIIAYKAEKIWKALFNNCRILKMSSSLYIAFANNYDKKEIYINETSINKIVGIGTWFSEKGFFEEAIAVEDLETFEQGTAKKLYGHYCFIIYNKEKCDMRVLSDPGGLINIYSSQEESDFYVSNDPKIVAELRRNVSLSKNGILEYVTKENTIGSETVFNEIRRLKPGHEFYIKNNSIIERKFYSHEPDTLTEDEYIEKVRNYFKAISKYKGIIATEMSAGYDTRVVTACAFKPITNLLAITNDNKSDRGVDLETSKIIANRLKMRLEKIIRPSDLPMNSEIMLHSYGIGRNIIRSKAMPYTDKVKYEHADLILGGYGGEVLRAKYCKFSDLEDFSKYYYGGTTLLDWGFIDTYENIKKKLAEEYSQDWIANSHQLSNWFYLMDRMRIWGGSAVLGKLIYGDRLHPFMDWQLAGPILQMNIEHIKDAKLLLKIIEMFSPKILDIPINASHPIILEDHKNKQYDSYSSLFKIVDYKKRLISYLRLFEKSNKKRIINKYSSINNLDEINQIIGLDRKKLLSIKDPNMLTRYVSMEILYRSFN